MKNMITLAAIVIIVVGMLMAFKFFVAEVPAEEEYTEGEALMEMEQETDQRVEALCSDIEEGNLSKEDCQREVERMLNSIFDNLFHLKDGEGSYLNAAYNCNIIRKLGARVQSEKTYEDAELALRKNDLSIFADQVFTLCLDVSRHTDEEAEYLKLCQRGERLQENLQEEVYDYVNCLFAWYRRDA